jgi:hypothetical protein
MRAKMRRKGKSNACPQSKRLAARTAEVKFEVCHVFAVAAIENTRSEWAFAHVGYP